MRGAFANVRIQIVSADPYTNHSSYHATEVESDTYAFGSTMVATFQAGRFDEAVSAAKRALIQNPRFTVALRVLAASLVKQGRLDDAADIVREVLNIEPQLTLTKLRARSMHMAENNWNDYSAALRLAGLPE